MNFTIPETITITNGKAREETRKVVKQHPSKAFLNLESDEPEPLKKPSHSFKMELQKARIAKKMSQADLAKACAINHTIVNKYERGELMPSPEVLVRINRALGSKL